MISILEGFNQRWLVLEGTLIGPWATELRTACGRGVGSSKPGAMAENFGRADVRPLA